MRLGGRTQAAIEVLTEIEKRSRPVADALKDWGLSHRFAGSGDRNAIGSLVYDALRKKLSLGYRIGSDTPRGLVFAVLLLDWKYSPEEIAEAFKEDKFAPESLSGEELSALTNNRIEEAALHVQADVPEWCVASLEANFAEDWVDEARALANRPPIDMRVNTLKSTREKVLKRLSKTGAVKTPIARNGIRIKPRERDARSPNVKAEEAYQKGRFEIQDEGSQIVADLVFAKPGEMVLDYCAGAGGKTLALAAAMENKGQVHAYDTDKSRLAPIHERLRRGGTRNVQVHSPDSDMSELQERMHKVVVDAPCTGSGTWRRRPDAKWRLSSSSLEERLREQEEALSGAAAYVKPGGHLIYITCSLFPEENENQVYGFCDDNPEYQLVSAGEVWEELFGHDKPQPWSSDMNTITLTPASTGTDGFFFAVMERAKA